MNGSRGRGAVALALVGSLLGWPAERLWGQEGAYATDHRRDPFVPLVTPEGRRLAEMGGAAVGNLNLEGIVWDPRGGSLAVINGATYREGDETAQFKVLQIAESSVKVLVQGQTRLLKLVGSRSRVKSDAEQEGPDAEPLP